MADWLVLWGATQAAGLFVKPILEEFAKDTGKDFAKDFFKDGLKKVIHLPEPKVLKEAYGKALKEFLQLMEQELRNAGCREEQISEYERPLTQFIQREEIAAALGQAFELDCRSIDISLLGNTWQRENLLPLPADFDWDFVSKPYVRAVKKLVNESAELRSIHQAQADLATATGMRDLVGIVPELDLRLYAEGLREQYGNVKLESLDSTGAYYNELKLWQIFVPQMVRECQEFLPQAYELPKEHERQLRERGELDPAEIAEAELERYHHAYRSQLSRSILEIVAGDSPVQKVVILGDPGAGKSALLQYLALIWAKKPLRDLPSEPTPLLIELRSYSRDREAGKCDDILTFIHSGNIICRLVRVACASRSRMQLHDRLKAGQAIALFDGIDEVFDPVQRDEVVRDIHRFSNYYPQVRVIVTSRWLGYKMQQLRDAGFQHFMLQDLGEAQISEFIQKWHDLTFIPGADKERKQTRLQRAVTESKAIRELAGNPLLLTMMAILNRHQELPRDRSELYNQASLVLLHQWDVEAKLLEDPKLKDWKISLDYRDKQAMMRKVAYFMQSSAKGLAGNIISATDLENLLTEHLRSTIEKGEPRMVARQMIYQLRHRNFILCYLGADSYAFVHRTFLEYFCAGEFVWQFKETQTLTIDRLINEVFAPHWQDETWHEVLRLICGSIDAKFVAEIVDYLLEQKSYQRAFLDYLLKWKIDVSDFLDKNKLKKEVLSNPIFAASCFVEVRHKQQIPTTATRLLTALRQEIEWKHSYFDREIALALTSTIATIGRDRAEILQWLKGCLNFDSYSVPESAVQAIANGWKDDLNTLPWLKNLTQHDNKHVRYAAVEALTKGWHDDPNILPMLKDIARHDNYEFVRLNALMSLEKWKDDPDTLPFLKHLAQSDDLNLVRLIAVRVIVKAWKDNPDTLPWVKHLAQHDFIAIEALAQGWKNNPQIFELLCHIAMHDRFQRQDGFQINPRQIALTAILENYPDRPEILDLLRDRSINDADEQVRKFAERELAKLTSI